MNRMKGARNETIKDIPMSAQITRDNVARFRKDKTLMNFIEVLDEGDLQQERDQ